MGLIKDALGAALGANQPQNGLSNGPFSRASKSGDQRYSYSASRDSPSEYDPHGHQAWARNPSPSRQRPFAEDRALDSDYPTKHDTFRRAQYGYDTTQDWGSPAEKTSVDEKRLSYPRSHDRNDQPPTYVNSEEQYFSPPPLPPRLPIALPSSSRSYVDQYDRDARSDPFRDDTIYRPFAIPQIEYGDGKPFLRAYSDELEPFGIECQRFIRFIDELNVAYQPNPENVVFQKAASIAGWFIPGSASLGLMGGQFVVGIGAAMGKQTQTSKVLCRANLDIFIPAGLEVSIVKEAIVRQAVTSDGSWGPNPAGFGNSNGPSGFGSHPADRVAAFGDALAPLTTVLQPLQNVGRQDPMAMLGHGISARENRKKLDKAQKDLSKGKAKKGDALESSLKWLIIQQATPDALQKWRQKAAEVEQTARDEQMARGA